MEIFWRRGYSGAPIKDVCDAMDLKPGSVYAAFGNKDGLFLAVIQRYLDQVNRPALDLLRSSASGIDGIYAYFDCIAEGIVNGNRRWGCLGTNAFLEFDDTDEEVSEIMMTHLIRLEEAFCAALERDGIGNAKARAKYLLCIAQGLNVIAKTGPDYNTLKAIIETAIAPIASSQSSVDGRAVL